MGDEVRRMRALLLASWKATKRLHDQCQQMLHGSAFMWVRMQSANPSFVQFQILLSDKIIGDYIIAGSATISYKPCLNTPPRSNDMKALYARMQIPEKSYLTLRHSNLVNHVGIEMFSIPCITDTRGVKIYISEDMCLQIFNTILDNIPCVIISGLSKPSEEA
jgi:hypothetical protein